jgi:hypothetical protein
MSAFLIRTQESRGENRIHAGTEAVREFGSEHDALAEATLDEGAQIAVVLFARYDRWVLEGSDIHRRRMRCLRQPGVFRPGLFDNRDLWVSVLPQRQNIFVGAFRLHDIA